MKCKQPTRDYTVHLRSLETLVWFSCFILSGQAQVDLDPRILSNTHLGPDPAILPSNRRAQAEPHIARSYSNPNLLVASWQSGRYASAGGAFGNEYAVSQDGGLTWARSFVPGLTSGVDGSMHQRASDPVVAVAFDNTIYQNSLGLNRSNNGNSRSFTLSVLTNASGEISSPIEVLVDQWPTNLLDKNWLAINSFPGSPTCGRIAVVGDLLLLDTHNSSSYTNAITVAMVSDDRGQTWSTPFTLVTGGSLAAGSAQAAFLPNGNLVVSLDAYRLAQPFDNRFVTFVSTDGGLSFGPASPVWVLAPGVENDVPSIRDGWFNQSMISDRLRGVLYMAWQQKGLQGRSNIEFSRSVDGGTSWSLPINVRDATIGVAFNPAIAASPDGQHVTILFYDSRGQGGLTNNVYLAESFDAGESWEPNVLVSSEPSNFANGPHTTEGYFYGDYHGITPALDLETPGVAIWIDGRNGDPDPYVAQIARTQGTTFQAWCQLRFTAEQLADPSVSGAAGDPEEDGIPNCLEYILGLEPDEFDSTPFVISDITTPGEVQLTYTALPVVTDKEILWQTSTDMTGWHEAEPIQVESERAQEAALRCYKVRLATNHENILFIRAGVRQAGLR